MDGPQYAGAFLTSNMLGLLVVYALQRTQAWLPLNPDRRTDGPLFVALLVGVVRIVGALTFLPALALGPIAEQLVL